MKTYLLLHAIAQIMSQHLRTLITVAVLLVGHCAFGRAQLHSQEHSKANVSISISTIGPRDERQSDADIVHYKDHFYIAFAKPIQKDETAFQILRSMMVAIGKRLQRFVPIMNSDVPMLPIRLITQVGRSGSPLCRREDYA